MKEAHYQHWAYLNNYYFFSIMNDVAHHPGQHAHRVRCEHTGDWKRQNSYQYVALQISFPFSIYSFYTVCCSWMAPLKFICNWEFPLRAKLKGNFSVSEKSGVLWLSLVQNVKYLDWYTWTESFYTEQRFFEYSFKCYKTSWNAEKQKQLIFKKLLLCISTTFFF